MNVCLLQSPLSLPDKELMRLADTIAEIVARAKIPIAVTVNSHW